MNCTKCGKQTTKESEYCSHCGNKLNQKSRESFTKDLSNLYKAKNNAVIITYMTVLFSVLLTPSINYVQGRASLNEMLLSCVLGIILVSPIIYVSHKIFIKEISNTNDIEWIYKNSKYAIIYFILMIIINYLIKGSSPGFLWVFSLFFYFNITSLYKKYI